ncbi:methionyl aminopeptidase [Calocera viscosa TUFC12733]|uniref:Methionine aminopeptidase n=1 Tax=Calocera viscosa (strain TUFC12733) TaxID=1330018 RepID=A0A167QTG5_CALVF|nr:methionyl aminopeptidase [Calocera viscosa TUFC12733]
MEAGYDILFPSDPYMHGVRHIPVRHVPAHIARPPYLASEEGYDPRPGDNGLIRLGGEEEKALRAAAQLAKRTLEHAGTLVRPGLTTDELDASLHSFILSHNAYPSPLQYHGFPKAVCTSINNVIAHGIPDTRPLRPDDIVNVDVTVYLSGFHGDTSRTFPLPEADARGRELVAAAEGALRAGIAACGPGRPFRAIGAAVERYLKSEHGGMSVSRQFSGHCIGRVFHRSPWILHHENDEPGVMRPGQCFTIEPCIVDDEDSRGFMWPDGWTVATETGARSAQAEHMVLVTETGVEVLTE